MRRESVYTEAVVVESSGTPGSGRALTLISRYIGVFVALLALIILCGWIFNIPALQTPFPTAIPMKANAALCFFFSGAALWLMRPISDVSPAYKIQRYAGYILASLTALIGLLTLLKYVFNWNIGIDQLIVREIPVSAGTTYPGRMSPYAAINFLVIGLSLLLIDVQSRRHHHPSSYLIIIVGLTSLISVIGYIYGADEFRGVPPFTPLALDASISFLLLFIGVLLARPTAATSALVSGDYPGRTIITFLIPALIILVVLTGWISLEVEHLGFYSIQFGVAVFSIISIALATTLIFLAAVRLHAADRRRRRSEQKIRELNATLEQQVEERTADLRKSEEKYRLIFENATEGIFQSTPEGKYISVNPAFARIGGFRSPDEMINAVADIQKEMYVNPEDRTRLIELLADQGSVKGYEFEIKRLDGARRWVSINVRAVRDPAGNITYLEGTLVDITDRMRTEAALRASEKRQRQFYESGLIGVIYWNMDGQIIDANGRFLKMLGYTRDDLANGLLDWAKMTPPEYRELDERSIAELKATGVNKNPAEKEYFHKDGTRIPVIMRDATLDEERYTGMAFVLDNTERKQAENRLILSEARYRELFENSGPALVIIDENGRYLMVNRKAAELYGRAAEEFTQSSIYDFVPKEMADRYLRSNRRLLEKGGQREYEDTLVLPNGIRSFLFVDTCLKDENGRYYAIQSSGIDITDRKEAELALQKSEEKYRLLAENVYDVVWTAGTDMLFTYVSPAIFKMRGFTTEEVLLQDLDQVVTPDSMKQLLQEFELNADNLEKGIETSLTIEAEQYCKDGSTIWTESLIRPIYDNNRKHTGYIGVTRDISKRRQAEQGLRESEEKFRNVFDYSAIGKSITTIDGKVNPNQALADMLGYSMDELSNVKWPEVSFPDDIEITNKYLEQLLSGEKTTARFIKRYIKKDGSIVWADVNTVLQRDKDGQPLYYITAVMDITGRKQAEEKLTTSEQRYGELFNHMANSVAVYEAVDNGEDFIFRDFSHSAELLEQVKKEDVLGRSVKEVFPGVVEFGLFDVFKRVWLTGVPESHPVSLYKDSRIIGWRENYIYKLPSGEIVAIYSDVTAQKQADEKLRSTAIFLNNMVDQSPTPTWISDDKGTMIRINRACCELLQVTEEAMVGNYNIFNDPMVEEQELMPMVRDVFEKGEIARFEIHMDFSRLKGLPPDKNTTLILQATMFPIRDAGGRITNAAVQVMDLTARKKAEAEVKEKTGELERSNTELERFAYVASHDLQEPLRTISSYIQMIERKYREKLDEKGLQYMDFTITAANRLQSMIEGLLEYSRVETRGQPFELVDCESVLRQSTDNLRRAIEASKAGITHDPLPSVPGDRSQLIRLFQNLLANSIKYRNQEPPNIHVSAQKKDRAWVFSIKDNGIGIDPEYREQIFTIFQRLHGRDVPGIGLGLSVAKRIVERHGGSIWVESEPDKGATFYFSIPVEGGKNK